MTGNKQAKIQNLDNCPMAGWRQEADRIIARVREATDLADENLLQQSASDLAQFIGSGLLTKEIALDELLQAARDSGAWGDGGDAEANIRSVIGVEIDRAVNENIPGFIRASDAARKIYAPPIWIVQNILMQGCLGLLVGRPKVGKSFMGINLALAVASGRTAFGGLSVQQGLVYYLDFESNEARLVRRLKEVYGSDILPDGLFIRNRWPSLEKGDFSGLANLLTSRRGTKLVVIDTLGRIKPPRKRDVDSFSQDYAFLGQLQRIASESGVCILLIHHCRKAGALSDGSSLDSRVDSVLGSTALTAVADTLLVLQRPKSDNAGPGLILSVVGRDVEEHEDLFLAFGDNGAPNSSWALRGDAWACLIGGKKRDVYCCLQSRGNTGASPAEIAHALNEMPSNVRTYLCRLEEEGLVRGKEGIYRVLKNVVAPVA